MYDWTPEFKALQARFDAAKIGEASEAELDRYLVVLANYIGIQFQQATTDELKQRIERVVKLALGKIKSEQQSKLNEQQIQTIKIHHAETHALAVKSYRNGGWAILIAVISIAVAILTAIQTHRDAVANKLNSEHETHTIPSTPSSTNSQLILLPTNSSAISVAPKALQSTNLGRVEK